MVLARSYSFGVFFGQDFVDRFKQPLALRSGSELDVDGTLGLFRGANCRWPVGMA